jgi:hypothetical protein
MDALQRRNHRLPTQILFLAQDYPNATSLFHFTPCLLSPGCETFPDGRVVATILLQLVMRFKLRFEEALGFVVVWSVPFVLGLKKWWLNE